MPARFKDLCFDANDHQALADWWCAALGYERRVGESRRLLEWPIPLQDPAGEGGGAVAARAVSRSVR